MCVNAAMARDRKSSLTRRNLLETLEARCLMSAGALDPSFSADGKATVNFGSLPAVSADGEVQGGGKIVVVGGDLNGGGLFSSADYDFAIARLNPDGSLDKAFAGSGKRIIGLGASEDARAVAIDYTGIPGINPNFGKIILAGHRFGP